MIRTLLTTSTIALMLSAGAMAQTDTTTPAPDATQTDPAAPADSMAPADPAAPADTTAPAETTAPAVAPAPLDTTVDATARTPWEMSAGYVIGADDVIVTQILGAPVYSSTADDAEQIGTVNDLVITADGDINAVVIGVGGFLGIGEKNVAVDFLSLEHSLAADNTWRWVLGTTREALEAAPEFIWQDPNAPVVDPMADPAMAPAEPAPVVNQ